MFLHLPRQWKESPKDMAASGPHGIARFYSDALLQNKKPLVRGEMRLLNSWSDRFFLDVSFGYMMC